jgi:hypothetical protein
MAKLTAKAVEAELRKVRGNVSAVARVFRVTRQAIIYHINKSQTLKQAVIDAREERLDQAESSLDKAIRREEAWAVCFALKTQGKNRGYVERTETRAMTDDDIDREIEQLAGVAPSRPAADAGEVKGETGEGTGDASDPTGAPWGDGPTA